MNNTELKLLKNLKESSIEESSYEQYLSNIVRTKNMDFSKYTKRKLITINSILKIPQQALLVITIHCTNPKTDIANVKTIAAYIAPFISILNSNPTLKRKLCNISIVWQDIADKLRLDINKVIDEKNSKLEPIIPYNTILLKRDEIRTKHNPSSMREHMQYLLLEVVTNILPKRTEIGNIHIIYKGNPFPKFNYVDSKIKEKTIVPFDINTANYLLIDNDDMTFHFNRFKTSKKKRKIPNAPIKITHISIEEKVPALLANIIKKSLKKYDRNFLFASIYGKKTDWVPYFKHNSYTTFFQSVFKFYFNVDKFAINDLRHSYVSYNIDFNTIPDPELDYIAKQMGTSSRTLFRVYRDCRKPTDDESDDEDD